MNRRLHIQRQKFSREFKIEVVKLVTERGLAVAQAARDLDIQRQSGCDERDNQDEIARLDYGMIVAIFGFCNA